MDLPVARRAGDRRSMSFPQVRTVEAQVCTDL